MQALILAAGRGSRLGNNGNGRPKCLLEVARRSLVDYQLEMLAEAGIAPVAMVVGYCADEIREAVGIRAEYIENPRWHVTNSLYSYCLARSWVNGPVFVLNSDILFHPAILDRLLDGPEDAFAYDSNSGNGREHMKVMLAKDGRLLDMRKDLPTEDSCGENVGILKLSEDTAKALFEIGESLIKSGHEKSWLGSAVREVAKSRTLHAIDIAGLPWGEIDSSYDLDLVRKRVWPAIRGTRWRRGAVMKVAKPMLALVTMLLASCLAYQSWFSSTRMTWENAELEHAPETRITAGKRQQTWWVLQAGNFARTRVTGPARIRLESRVVLPSGEHSKPLPREPRAGTGRLTSDRPGHDDAGSVALERLRYVLEVTVDGKPTDWYKFSPQGSSQWTLDNQLLGRPDRIPIDVAEGEHEVGVRLITADAGRALIRVQHQTADEED